MTDNGTTGVWLGLATLAGFGAGLVFRLGTPVLPLFLCGLALTCALHRPSRKFVMEKAGKAFSGSTLRLALIVVGAMLIWQLVGIELALLMAGDVLAYVEVVAAVSLIAANTRLAPMKARLKQRLDALRLGVVIRLRAAPRSIRAPRPPRRNAPPAGDSDGDAGWAFV